MAQWPPPKYASAGIRSVRPTFGRNSNLENQPHTEDPLDVDLIELEIVRFRKESVVGSRSCDGRLSSSGAT